MRKLKSNSVKLWSANGFPTYNGKEAIPVEFITLLKANLKRHKGGLAGIFILLFLVSLSLVTVLTIWENSNSYIPAAMRREI